MNTKHPFHLLCYSIGLVAATILTTPTMHADEDFKPIFNGEDLSEWSGNETFWRVEDGQIVGETTAENPTQGNTYLIWQNGKPGNFELRLKYRIDTPWANSGIQIRSKDLGNHVVAGPQPDIATDDWITGIHYEERGRGVLARRGQKIVINKEGERETSRFAEEDALAENFNQSEWTDYHIIANGNTITAKINGHTMHEIIDDSPEASHNGIIAIQLHSGDPMTIRFKDIQLKILDNQD